jgi:hypothetical protein
LLMLFKNPIGRATRMATIDPSYCIDTAGLSSG